MRRMRFGGWVFLGTVLTFLAGVSVLTAGDSPFFSSEASVIRAQEILVGDGYLKSGSFERGTLDNPTRQALAGYQSDHALNDRGFLDDETFNSLVSHETAYPWDSAPAASPTTAAQPYERSPAKEVEVAQAPVVPAPVPAPAEEKEATAEPEPASDSSASAMPATGSNLPLLAISGLALLGTGALLLRRSA